MRETRPIEVGPFREPTRSGSLVGAGAQESEVSWETASEEMAVVDSPTVSETDSAVVSGRPSEPDDGQSPGDLACIMDARIRAEQPDTEAASMVHANRVNSVFFVNRYPLFLFVEFLFSSPSPSGD